MQRVLALGSDAEIETATGIPRRTINGWRRGNGRRSRERRVDPNWRPSEPAAYCYVLGIYLGDGCLSIPPGKGAFLRIAMDAVYGDIVEEVMDALAQVFEGSRVCRYERSDSRSLVLQLSHPVLPVAFPQHGPGKKHGRKIELVDWQRELTYRHPRELIRGLIHSDGCRTLNEFDVKLPSGRVAHYSYPRYFFTNLSADIRGIFCEHCDLLGIRWTQSNARNISVSHRDSVAILDSFVGPKT